MNKKEFKNRRDYIKFSYMGKYIYKNLKYLSIDENIKFHQICHLFYYDIHNLSNDKIKILVESTKKIYLRLFAKNNKNKLKLVK